MDPVQAQPPTPTNVIETHEKVTKPEAPDRVLIWIQEKGSSIITRCLFGLGLAEGFKKAGSESIKLCTPNFLNLEQECANRNIQWQDNNQSSLTNITNEYKPEVVLADVDHGLEFSEPVLNTLPMLFYIAPYFHEPWMNVDGLIIPGLSHEPDFMKMNMLPARLAQCVQGAPFVCLPEIYGRMASDVGSGVLVAIHEQIGFQEEAPWIKAISSTAQENFRFLMDGPEEQAKGFAQGYGEGRMRRSVDSIKKRLQAIDSAEVVLTLPGLNVYEFLARGKAVVILTRNEEEQKWAELFKEKEAAEVMSTKNPNLTDDLEMLLLTIMAEEEVRSKLENNARLLVQGGGGSRLVNVLLTRWG